MADPKNIKPEEQPAVPASHQTAAKMTGLSSTARAWLVMMRKRTDAQNLPDSNLLLRLGTRQRLKASLFGDELETLPDAIRARDHLEDILGKYKEITSPPDAVKTAKQTQTMILEDIKPVVAVASTYVKQKNTLMKSYERFLNEHAAAFKEQITQIKNSKDVRYKPGMDALNQLEIKGLNPLDLEKRLLQKEGEKVVEKFTRAYESAWLGLPPEIKRGIQRVPDSKVDTGTLVKRAATPVPTASPSLPPETKGGSHGPGN